MRVFRLGIQLSFFLVWTLNSPQLFADEELNLDFADPPGPFLAVEHVGPQDHTYHDVLVTDDPTQKLVRRDDVQLRLFVTSQEFANRFATVGERLTGKALLRGRCDAHIAHPEYAYAVSGRITGLDNQEFCFILNPRDSTRLLQGLLIESLKNAEAPAELEHVLDQMLGRMPTKNPAE